MSEAKQVGVIKPENYPGLFGEKISVMEVQGVRRSGGPKKPRIFLRGDGYIVQVNSQKLLDVIFGRDKPESPDPVKSEKPETKTPENPEAKKPENSEKTNSEKTPGKPEKSWVDDL